MNDLLGMHGHFDASLYDCKGELKGSRSVDNVITITGKGMVSGLILLDIAGTAFDHIGIGTGDTAATNTQSALVGEVIRTAGTGTQITSTSTNDTAQLVATFALTGSFTIAESGVFNHATTGNGSMLARQVFAALNTTSGDTLVMTWKVLFV